LDLFRLLQGHFSPHTPCHCTKVPLVGKNWRLGSEKSQRRTDPRECVWGEVTLVAATAPTGCAVWASPPIFGPPENVQGSFKDWDGVGPVTSSPLLLPPPHTAPLPQRGAFPHAVVPSGNTSSGVVLSQGLQGSPSPAGVPPGTSCCGVGALFWDREAEDQPGRTLLSHPVLFSSWGEHHSPQHRSIPRTADPIFCCCSLQPHSKPIKEHLLP